MMDEERAVLSRPILVYLAVVALVDIVVSVPRFGYVYPDSLYYFDSVDFFRGILAGTELTAPFCYRPALPALAAILPIDPVLTFSIVNLAFVILLSWVILLLAMEFGLSDFSAFLASLVCSASLANLFYGSVVLVDPGALFFLALAYHQMMKNGDDKLIAVLFALGVLYKEVALVGVLAFLIHRRLRGWYWMILPIAVYGALRLLIPSGNPGFLWTFHLDNLTSVAPATVRTFAFGLGPHVLLFLIGLLMGKGEFQSKARKWLVSLGIPGIGYMILGLFFAHFDVRFLWPLQLSMVPLIGIGATAVIELLRRYIPLKAPREEAPP
ncbi:MAG: hypothetical protein ACFFH0_01315 [Promethearchaeota archaeon]